MCSDAHSITLIKGRYALERGVMLILDFPGLSASHIPFHIQPTPCFLLVGTTIGFILDFKKGVGMNEGTSDLGTVH